MDIPLLPLVGWSRDEGRPLLIAGPCSAESEAQVLETARRLATTRIDYFRAGIWKARTRPGNFEGIGEPALSWLRRAGQEFGLKTAIEVAHPHHVEAAVEHDIDLLWLGARTTVNPFSVQELADALRGCDRPVLIKNPTSLDLPLWLGAIERVAGAGVRSIGAVHRGVSVANAAPYRNAPTWTMALELRRALPEIPIISDPSHICGRRDLVPAVAQRAMDLGFDGLMIETHPAPDQAWSDAAQQVTPEQLGEILAGLTIRRGGSDDEAYRTAMESLRERIDDVDNAIVGILAERMEIIEQIAEQKRANNVTTFQLDRWRQLLVNRMERAERLGLDPEYAKAIYQVIHRESLQRQSAIMSRDAKGKIPPPEGPDPLE